MGDAKVKQQPFFGAQPHHHRQHHHHHRLHESSASESKSANTLTGASTGTMATTSIESNHTNSAVIGGGSQQQPITKEATVGPRIATNAAKDKSPGSLKYDQLKLRKQELEKRLNEKYSQLQQIKREEAQLIGMYPSDFSCGIGQSGLGENGTCSGAGGANSNGMAPTLRRKIGTSFKLPENLLNNKEDDINKLLLEKQIQQQISEASLRLANDSGQPKSVRRTHKQNYEMAQQKLLAINQNLSVLKKRQQQKEQQQQQQALQQPHTASEYKPTVRDDIDLHKTAQVNRFRSNSNSSSMVMHLSERRNSVKSNNSSNASGSIVGHHHQLQHQHQLLQQQQQQLLQVQIPGGHYHLPHAQGSQQISPYSVHSGIIPSGSQSMTSAASAAMISQLSMLRHRARTDSFPGIATNYDTTSTGSGSAEQNIKISPLSGSGSIVSGGSLNHHPLQSTLGHHHPHHHHHQIGPGPSRMNRLIQQQIGVNYSPPPAPSTMNSTPAYIISPTASVNGAQAFVYDAKVISRLQGNGGVLTENTNMLHSPQGAAAQTPSSSYGHSGNDQNYCPSSMASTTPTSSSVGAGGYEHGSHEAMAIPSSGGLGGYWTTSENGEKVWCSVDSRQFSSLDRKQQIGVQAGSMKLSRTSTKLSDRAKPSGQFNVAVKSSSLGNFQEAIGKSTSLDDSEMISVQPDAISVTSGSSEHKKREKVWRETSLDSPLVKHKALPPVPSQSVQGQMSPSSTGSGYMVQSPNTLPQSPSYMQAALGQNASTVPLHINTNICGYIGASSPLLLSPQQMRYYQQRQQQLLEQQRQRIKHQQLQQPHQQQQQHQQHQQLQLQQQHQQQQYQNQQQQQQQYQNQQQQQQQLLHHRLMFDEQQQQMNSTSARQPDTIGGGSLHPHTTKTSESYNPYHYQQQQQPIPPPYHSRQQHPPPPPLPPQNQHHYHHSQQQLQSRTEHPPTPSVPLSQLVPPQHLDLLPQSYSQQFSDRAVAHLSPSSGHIRMGTQDGFYPHQGQLCSRHPDLLISPTLSQSSSQTLTSPTATAVVQALPVVGGLEDNVSISPTPSVPGGGTVPSDIQMESPKNMTVVQQGKIMPYKEVTKPFEMSDFYKYSTKYRQKQQQHQQPVQGQQQEDSNPKESDIGANGSSTGIGGDGIHKGIYQPPNRSICQPIANNYN